LSLDGHVTFVGHIRDRPALQDLYARSTVIIVVPSIWPEVSARGGIESMSVGRFVIASDVGGLSDWLHHGRTGYLVPPGDPGALSDALLSVFADPAANVVMGRHARTVAETYDMALHAERIEQVYREVLHDEPTDTARRSRIPRYRTRDRGPAVVAHHTFISRAA
jgi:glycosyltransferase involved in cell wall biosynthesis